MDDYREEAMRLIANWRDDYEEIAYRELMEQVDGLLERCERGHAGR